MSWINSVFNDEDDLEAQDGWSERPWRWLPTAIQYPTAVAGGIYREMFKKRSVLEKKDPTLNKDSSDDNMPKGKKKKVAKRLKKKLAKAGTRKRAAIAVMRQAESKMFNPRGRRRGPRPQVSKVGRTTGNYPGIDYQRKVSAGSTVVFSSGSRSGCLRMHCKVRLGIAQYTTTAITQNGTSTPYPCIGVLLDASNTLDTVVPFNPSLAYYFPGPLQSMAQNFQTFRFDSASIIYQTSSPTALAGKLMFSYSPDVRYLDSRGYTSTNRYLGEFDLARIACTKTFPVYENVRFNIPIERAGMKYVRSIYGNTAIPYQLNGSVVADSSEDRDCIYGIWMFTSNVPSTTVNGTQFGDLYLETTVELCDLASVITSAVSLTSEEKQMQKFRAMLARVQLEDQEDDSKVTVQTVTEDEAKQMPGYAILQAARSAARLGADQSSRLIPLGTPSDNIHYLGSRSGSRERT